ncbi:unnamed protein product [Brachionus calyciflorus]|uniref:HAT C-terminal dimerisation domain-containing protein n=1 Tax=Brachionus calyciflorus TaxID=104777 RepID=A0A814P982_9BILA|nr:unnamed protein product [Brachionus calyciflorus]
MNFDLSLVPSDKRLSRLKDFFLKENASKAFGEIFTLYKKYLALPVSNANSERSFSVLKRIKSYLQNTMSQDRLNDLSFIHIESEEADQIDVENVLEVFIRTKNRRLKFF